MPSWKLSAGDWIERQNWRQYQTAYESALTKCSTEFAPWIIVPADHKWYRDLAVAQRIVDTLQPYKRSWVKSLEALGKEQLREIELIRAQEKESNRHEAGTKKANQAS